MISVRKAVDWLAAVSTKLLTGAALLFAALFCLRKRAAYYCTALTAATLLYHLRMRRRMAGVVNRLMHNHADYTAAWFQPRRWEKPLYRRLQVKHWKRWLPTYDPDTFDLHQHSLSEVAQVMCQSEIVHEVSMALSFLPVLTAPLLGCLPMLAVTSGAAALLDGALVILQRYNRPRILHLIAREKRRAAAAT